MPMRVRMPHARAHAHARANATREAHPETDLRTNFRAAFAKPSFSWLSVTALACALTASLELPMAMEKPLLRNIGTSFGMSPIVAICSGGMFKRFDRVVTTVP